ncbi:MAG: hypothetical protein RLZZ290_624 [Pseudomonadota bacterium]
MNAPRRVRAAVLRKGGQQGPFRESRPLSFEEVWVDPPGFGEIQVRVRAASLCHSDLSAINGDRPWPTPLVIGHEASGEVVAIGDGVSRFSIGDPVVMVFKPFCGQCQPCLIGRGVLCEPGSASNAKAQLLGGYHRLRPLETQPSQSGSSVLHHHMGVAAFSEVVTISQHSAVRIQAGLPWEVAALFGCAVLTGAGAVFNTAMVRPGQSVAVVGLGGVGCSALLAARAAGATVRVAIDPVPEKRALAMELGATHAFDSSGVDVIEAVKRLTAGGVDIALEMAGAVPALELAYAIAQRGGQVVSAGLPNPAARWPLAAASLIAEEKTIKGSYMGSAVPIRDIPRYIALMLAGQLPVQALLGRVIALEELNDALDALASGQALRQVVRFE